MKAERIQVLSMAEKNDTNTVMVKNKKYKKIFFAIILLYAISFIVTFVFVILPLLPVTKHSYKDYETFRHETGTRFLTDMMPASAEPEYYFHSVLFSKQSGYRVQLADDDYDRLKEEAQERYLSYKKSHEKTGSLYIGGSDGAAAPDYSKLENEGLGFIKDELIRSDDGFYLLYDFRIDDSEVNYRSGMMCNDKTNEIIEFYARKAKAN